MTPGIEFDPDTKLFTVTFGHGDQAKFVTLDAEEMQRFGEAMKSAAEHMRSAHDGQGTIPLEAVLKDATGRDLT